MRAGLRVVVSWPGVRSLLQRGSLPAGCGGRSWSLQRGATSVQGSFDVHHIICTMVFLPVVVTANLPRRMVSLLVRDPEHQPLPADLLPPQHVQRLLRAFQERGAFDDLGCDGPDGALGGQGGHHGREHVFQQEGVLAHKFSVVFKLECGRRTEDDVR